MKLGEFKAKCRQLVQAKATEKRVIVGFCLDNYSNRQKTLELYQAIKETFKEGEVLVKVTGPLGWSDRGVLLTVQWGKDKEIYEVLTIAEIREIISSCLVNKQLLPKYRFNVLKQWEKSEPSEVKKITADIGFIDPASIEDYMAAGGHRGFTRVLEAGQDYCHEIRSRFQAEYELQGLEIGELECICFEQDPASRTKSYLMAGNPYLVMEGVLTAAKLLNVHKATLMVSQSSGLVMERIRETLDQLRAYGLLGQNVLGSGWDFDVFLKEVSSAIVEPANPQAWRLDCEAAAGIPFLVNDHPLAARKTKLVTINGMVKYRRVVEVEPETTVKQLLYELGGGPLSGISFKGAKLGGFYGNSLIWTAMDKSLSEATNDCLPDVVFGLDSRNCPVSLAAQLIILFAAEARACKSCNKCMKTMSTLKSLIEGVIAGNKNSLNLITQLEGSLQEALSLAACTPFREFTSSIGKLFNAFKEEFILHIEENNCPGGICQGISPFPCSNGCPAGVDNNGEIALLKQGKYREALQLVRQNNPLILVCGRVCEEPLCQEYCRRQVMDEPVDTKRLHRFAGEMALKEYGDWAKVIGRPELKFSCNKKVAVVGAGPAGLTAAYFLKMYGYEVEIYEANSFPGGALATGIPKYRLPRDILNAEIQAILDLGVGIHYSKSLGFDFKLADIRQAYAAVLLAIGSQKAKTLPISGGLLAGVISALDFLREVNLTGDFELGEKVVVIGGGNVAIDAARTAVRLGKDVSLYCLEPEDYMPASKAEVEAALEEGVKIKGLTRPIEFLGNGKIEKVKLGGVYVGGYHLNGLRKFIPVNGNEYTVEASEVIVAIGQGLDLEAVKDAGLETTLFGNLKVNLLTLETSIKGVFAAGDCVSGPKTVVEAVGAGHRAARAIDRSLGGDPFAKEEAMDIRSKLVNVFSLDGLETARRASLLSTAIDDRIKNFQPVEYGLTKEEARWEMNCCVCSPCKDRGQKRFMKVGVGL